MENKKWTVDEAFFCILLPGAGSFHEVWQSFDVVLMTIEATLGRFYKRPCSSESSFLSFYHEMISSLYNPIEQDINWEGKWLHCYYFRFKSRFFCPFLPRSFNFIMSGNSVTCIKLHLFTTDWTWTYDCSPVLYHSTSLSVNLLWNSNCKAFGKSTFFVFKRNIGVFSV